MPRTAKRRPLLSGSCDVRQCGLHLARERVVGRGGLVGPLDDGDGPRVLQHGGEPCLGERTEARQRDATDAAPGTAQLVDDGDRGIGDRAHRDDDRLGVLAAVRVDEVVRAAGDLGP